MKNGFWLLLLALVFLLMGCNQPPPPPATTLSYFELIWEQEPCLETVCFKEFIVASDGTFFAKTAERNDGLSTPAIFLGQLNGQKTTELFEWMRENQSVTASEQCVTCYRLYFLNGDSLFVQQKNADVDTPEWQAFFQRVSQLKTEAVPVSEPIYAKIVFKEQGKPVADHHFFPSGLIVKEIFGSPQQELSEATLEKKPEKILSIKNRLTPGFFSSQTELNCLPNLVYGYLEALFKNRFASHWVCGAGNTEADALFAELYGEKK